MEGRIDPDMPLDYIELRMFPSKNRYDARVCVSNRARKVASGSLEHVLLHSPRVKRLSSKGLNTNLKILPPDSVDDAEWFTTTTLTRFLHIIRLPDILSIANEINQLEVTRKFQLSLSAKAEVDITSSIDSKNELLRAVDLRLTALTDGLVAAFDQATGARCSTKDISDLENFAHHFGAKDIRDSLQKFVEMSLFPTVEDSRNNFFSKTEISAPAPQPSHLHQLIKYNVAPATVSQVEEDASEDEKSSFSSEEDQPFAYKSRAPSRFTTPRRTSSPMKRIQIGRLGSHRATALTIKSLNYFPAREKVTFQRDPAGSSSDEEDPEKPSKNDVLRMSVKDKISLFESKRIDQRVDVSKKKKLLNTTVGPNKTVLRRWSSGMGEDQISAVSPKNVASQVESIINKDAENIKPHSPEPALCVKVDTLETEKEESCEKHPASIEWNQQEEAELNDLFMKMMENKNKSVRHQNPSGEIINSKKKSPNDHSNQKRGEKLRGEASGNKAEKEPQFKVLQMISNNVDKPQKTPSINSKKEPSKPSVIKKTTSKMSNLPATRKSLPSTPTAVTLTSRSTTPTSQIPQSVSSAVRPIIKSEKSQPRSKTLKPTTPDANRSLETIENKQPAVTKIRKTWTSVVPLDMKSFRKGSGIGHGVGPVGIKTKVVGQPEETSETSVSLIQSEVNEVVMITDISENHEEREESESQVSGSLIQTEETEVAMITDISENREECEEPESQVASPTKCEKFINNSGESALKMIEEELISPTAWVEIEDHEEEINIPYVEEIYNPCKESQSPVQVVSPVNVVAPAKPASLRVRHSLSQILLEESSEEADNCEWGNAEHPPALVYQKDSPKGFKRLLKFARKNKAESALSEGDGDAEEAKGSARRTRARFFNTKKR